MGVLREMLNQCLNYFFPPNGYLGKKITDKKWVRFWTCIAPYTSIGVCVTMALWGWLGNPGRPFLLTKQGGPATAIALFVCILFLMASALRNRHRSPAIPFLIANFFSLILFLGFLLVMKSSTLMREKLEEERNAFSQMVENRIQDRKALMTELTQKKEEEVRKSFEDTRKQIREIGDQIPDLSKMRKEIHEWRDKCWEDATKRGDEAIKRMEEAFFARSAIDAKKRKKALAKFLKQSHSMAPHWWFNLEESDFEDDESEKPLSQSESLAPNPKNDD